MLHSQAELSRTWAGIIVVEVGETAWEERSRSGLPRLVAGVGIREVNSADARLIGIRWIGIRAIDVVALHALEEHSKAAANDSFAISGHVIGKANTGLNRSVEILHQASREAIHAR